jgi:hypothetical protein
MSFRITIAGIILCISVLSGSVFSVQAVGDKSISKKAVVPLQVKATWIWDTELILTEPKQIMDFAITQKINLIYLQIDTSFRDASYSAFIKLATEKGIEIHALGGDPHWVLPSEQKKLKSLVGWVKDYNRKVSAQEQFRGVHIDMEPYILPDWKKDRSKIVKLWMEAIRIYTAAMKDSGLTKGADVPFWLDGIPTSAAAGAPTLDEWMMGQMDHVTIMAYRNMADTPNGIIALVADELAAAVKHGKKVIVAVEALPSEEGKFISFSHKGRAALTVELNKVMHEMRDNPSFLGYAVHDYRGWRDLRK